MVDNVKGFLVNLVISYILSLSVQGSTKKKLCKSAVKLKSILKLFPPLPQVIPTSVRTKLAAAASATTTDTSVSTTPQKI